MLNKNQFEKSIIVLKENIPVLIRDGYTKFNHILRTTVDKLNILNEERPSSVKKITNQLMLGNVSLLYLYSSLVSETEFNDFLCNSLSRTTIYDANVSKLNSDEEFSLSNSSDIYAPVNELKLSLTAFSSKKFRHLLDIIPITYEASYEGVAIGHVNSEKINNIVDSTYITDLFGRKTIFDELHTTCIIDFRGLCDKFLNNLVRCTSNIPDNDFNLNDLISIKELANSEECIQKIFTCIEKDIMASAIATYLVYASKLIGAKPDIFQWAYSSFVKDAQTHFDKSHYPLNAPVTFSSGHSVTGYTYGNKNNKFNEATVDMNVAQIGRYGGDDSSDPTKALIYRNIRLNHSAWSSVMNTILSGCPRNAFKDNTNKAYATKTASNIYEFAVQVLSEYIKSKTRTYNTSYQLTQSLKLVDSFNLIQYSADQIKESNSANIIKNNLSNVDENCCFIKYDENIAGLLTLNNNVSKTLADTFLDASYLLLLSYSHDYIGNIIEETDPTTGKTNKELFEEIYYGISSKINIDIEKFSYHEKCVTMQKNIDASIAAYTPYFSCCDNSIDELNDLISGIIVENYQPPYPNYDPYENDINAPLISEYTRLKKFYFVDDINKNATISVNIERNKGRFPKNRIVTSALTNYSLNNGKRIFTSLESIDEFLKTLESLSEEGADAMANNAAYSALGSIGSTITELEITNSADHNTTDKTPLDSVDTDGDNYIIKEGTNDAEYMTKVVAESFNQNVEEHKTSDLVKKYNSIFNKMLLNI